MKIVLLLISIALIIYAIAFHRAGSKKKFYFIAYWNSLTPKGAVIYTCGLAILVYTIFFYR